MTRLNTTENTYIDYTLEYGPKKMGIMYLHGFMSSQSSVKGQILKEYAAKNGYSFLSLDYTAHGLSSGSADMFRVGQCLADIMAVLSHTKYREPFVVVGSSLGGWLSLLVAEKYPSQVKGVLALAPGADFLDRLWESPQFIPYHDVLMSGDMVGPSEETNGYCFTYEMFTDATEYNVLNRAIGYEGPVLLVHGMKDTMVPYSISLKLIANLESKEVKLLLLKDEMHLLSGCNLSNILNCFLKELHD